MFIALAGCSFQTLQAQSWNEAHAIGTVTGETHFPYNQTPPALVELRPAAFPNTGLTYQWQFGYSPLSFIDISGATGSSYSFSSPLNATVYVRRITTNGALESVYSNTVKLTVVSTSWEDRNYIREHNVRISGQTTWQDVDALSNGEKLQTTSYMDGLGRTVQQVSKGTATPADPGDQWAQWGDKVQFFVYDQMGKEPIRYLPYTTTTELGSFKTSPIPEQTQYYTTAYNETSAFGQLTFDNSPLSRLKNSKAPGTVWAAGAGNSNDYETNEAADDVQQFSVSYNQGSPPVHNGAYQPGTLYKSVSTDENGKRVIEFTDKEGKLILRKVELDDDHPTAHAGWICTYSVYDDFGQMLYQLQPEAVKYVEQHNWSFAGSDGIKVLNELCFQYTYDERGYNTWKKAPGAEPLLMLYDKRGRPVFTQDGNQRQKSPQEWTVTLYDELDRPILTTLYQTVKNLPQIQADLDNAPAFMPLSTSSGVNQIAHQSPLTAADLNNASVCTVLKYRFYDDYSFPDKKDFQTAFENGAAYSYLQPDVEPATVTRRTLGFCTGSRVRILGTATFLNTTTYFDDRGAPLQTLEDNHLSGTDATTLQYHFDGRVMSTFKTHAAAGTGYSGFAVLTRNVFDKIGRIASIDKQWGTNDFQTIAQYTYDDMGRLKTKRLAPGYRGRGRGELESLTYSYNLHNLLTGINKDYALKTPGLYRKWDHFFGLYLGYDNADGIFSAARLNGQVAGALWNTQGDDAQRKYDYGYDNAGRLITALFNEKKTANDAWSHTLMDFSVTGADGKMGYDLNGNLLSMIQKGVTAGSTAPVIVDDLQYSYASLSNKLMRVTDNSSLGAANGKAGDFKDGTNGTDGDPANDDDYDYDANGNLVIDRNKGATDLPGQSGNKGIRYNFLDKAEEIRIAGKGTIKMVYDADGNKLQRTFIPESGGSTMITHYVSNFVYGETVTNGQSSGLKLQYFSFEEGRVRPMQPVNQNNGYDFVSMDGNLDLPDGSRGAIDYYVRDYQQNVRMILTRETHIGSNQCTMETARASDEEALFGQPGGGNEVALTRFAVSDIPGQSAGDGWQHPYIGSQVSRLGALAAGKVGPNALLKVMAGDEISARADYYYQSTVSNGTGNNLLQPVLTSLLSAIAGSAAVSPDVKGGAATIYNNFNDPASPFASAVAPDAGDAAGNNPKAYLNVLFFNERMEFVEEESTFRRVMDVGNGAEPLYFLNARAPKNGYCYVYLSNESNEPVYFDNFTVTHNRGRIIEENHYYAYGLRIQSLSSRKVGEASEGHLNNQQLYNDKELIEDADLGWYDYGFRNYDPQIGRFPQLDPLTFDYPFLTPYQYASGDPATNIDIDGLEGQTSVLPTVTITAVRHAAAKAATVTNSVASTLRFTFSFYNVYSNARGHTFLEAETADKVPLASQCVLGEEWQHSDRRMVLESTEEPYTGPEFRSITKEAMDQSPYRAPDPEFDDSYMLGKAHQWRMEKLAARNHGFPIIDNLLGGVNYIGAGETGKGFRKLRSAGIETATWLLPGTKIGKLIPRGGGGALVNMTEETFSQALFKESIGATERIGSYSIDGTKGLVGNTFNRNIFYLKTNQPSLAGFRSLVNEFETEAIRSGANKISIFGSSVINPGLLNPKIAGRFGYSFEQSGNGVFLQKFLK